MHSYDMPSRLLVALHNDLPVQIADASERISGSAESHTSSLLMSLGNNVLV